MIIETALLARGPMRFEGEEAASILDLDDDEFVRAEEPARYDLSAQLTSFDLVVRGSITIQLSCRCARCDEWTAHTIRVRDFVRTYKLETGNSSIDLTDDMREDILLAFPIRFICSSSCSGLCPQCGKNLNKLKCCCAEHKNTEGWNALEQLKIEE